MKKAIILAGLCASLNAQVFEFDQGFDSGASGGNAVLTDNTLSQTFTVGIEGALREVHLNLFKIGNPENDLILRVYRENGELVHFQSVWASIPDGMENSTMIPITMRRTDLDMPLGSTWELRLTSGNDSVSDSVEWTRAFDDPYAGGVASVDGLPDTDKDFSFFTFVEPKSVPVDNLAAIPEPGTYAAVFAGGLMLFSVIRKIRQR